MGGAGAVVVFFGVVAATKNQYFAFLVVEHHVGWDGFRPSLPHLGKASGRAVGVVFAVDLPQHFGCGAVGDVDAVIAGSATAHANVQVGGVGAIDDAVVVFIVVPQADLPI